MTGRRLKAAPGVRMRSGSRELIAGLAVAAIACLVYANSLGNGFVWDDDFVIVRNAALRGDALTLFRGIDTGRASELTPYYRPLTLLSFLVEERLHGLRPMPMHLVNVLLHAANALLVYLLARTVIARAGAAFFAGLLFAVHPLHSESVNFLSGGRNTMLACLFALSAYLLHHTSLRKGGRMFPYVLGGALAYLAGLFSKETAAAILPFIVALEIPFLRSAVGRSPALGRLAPYSAAFAAYLMLRHNALSGAGVAVEVFPGLWSRLLDNVFSIPRYLLTVIWPPSLGAKYFVPDDLHLYALPLVAAWLAILSALLWLLTRGRSRASTLGLFWAVAFWLPVSGVIPIPSAPLADRYVYVSAIGIWLVVADQVFRLLPAAGPRFPWGIAALALACTVLAAATVRRTMDWRSDIALFSSVVRQYPDRAFGYHNLGCAFLDKRGDLNQAERTFEKALSIDPHFPRLRTQLGYVRLLRGDYEAALGHYSEAIRNDFLDAEAHLNAGIAFDRLGRYDEAVAAYRRFLAMPGDELAGSRPFAEDRVRVLSAAGQR